MDGKVDEDGLPLYGPECTSECPCHERKGPDRLGVLDRFLSLWILAVMAAGLLVGYFAPQVGDALRSVEVGSVSLPVALGLIVMLLPVFCKVPYERLRGVVRAQGLWRQLVFSVVVNWAVGPLLMTALAWATLPDLPHYRNGVILIGLARCIAMVLLWNALARGSAEYCAILVAVNACLQLVLYSPLAVLLIDVVSDGVGSGGSVDGGIAVFFWQVTESVLIFLGVPFALGVTIRYTLLALAGARWFDSVFVPRFSPLALVGLLFTIFVLFAAQGRDIINQIGPVARVSVPLLLYFTITFISTLLLARWMRFPHALAVTQAFTASSNNFELAIAIAVATFGVTSPEALAAVVGPLIEVPVMLALVYVARWTEARWGGKEKAWANELS